MGYRLTTQREVRREFWREHVGVKGVTPRRIKNYSGSGKMHNTDTRCAFADFVDYLSKSGAISSELAHRVTL